MITIGVVQFPGSNCERETAMAVERSGMQAVDVMWNSDTEQLDSLDGFVISGGFSYEDRCRSGSIAAKSPLMQALAQQAQQGKPILGICNGAQVLVETGLVPGFVDTHGKPVIAVALSDNLRMIDGQIAGDGYFNDWCHIKATADGPFSQQGQQMHIPFAHAQGRFMLSDATYQTLKEAGVAFWQYTDAHGNIDPNCPINPNGSLDNLAAISNLSGNVMAMMPHPERSENGDVIFQAMRQAIEGQRPTYQTQTQSAEPADMATCHLDDKAVLVRLAITDNEAVSVQQTLHHMGFTDVEVKKWTLWNIQASDPAKSQIMASNELLNPNKEVLCAELPKGQHYFIVQDKTDVKGQYVHRTLQDQWKIADIDTIEHGIIWGISSADPKTIDAILASHLLANPISQDIAALELHP